MLGGSGGRGRPDVMMMPTRPSLGDLTGQVCPVHRAGHADVRKKQPDVGVCFEQSQGLVGIPASSTRYPASENMPDAPMRSSTSSSTTRTRAWEGELSNRATGTDHNRSILNYRASCSNGSRLASSSQYAVMSETEWSVLRALDFLCVLRWTPGHPPVSRPGA